MLLITAEEMRRLDERTIEEAKVPVTTLMENAGRAAAQQIMVHFPPEQFSQVLIISGHGNNGGDGLVVARELHNMGYQVESWLVGSADKISTASCEKLKLLRANGQDTRIIEPAQLVVSDYDFTKYDIIVDALIGIGGVGPLRAPLSELVRTLNMNSVKRVALDISTGINTDRGVVESTAFKADLTVTFAVAKFGHFLGAGSEYTGALVVIDIGLPREFLEDIQPKVRLLTAELISTFIPARKKQSHKGSYGHALIVGGSRDMPGAPALAAKSALRAGAGLTTLVVPNSIRELIFSYLPEALFVGLTEHDLGHLSSLELEKFLWERQVGREYTASCYGCGVGRWPDESEMLKTVINGSTGPLVIDADGLNALSEGVTLLKERKSEVILTPHPKEMARLLGADVTTVNANRLTVAHDFAVQWQVYLVLKGAGTVVATPDGELFINSSGGPELAKGGTGDVLAGLLSGLLAQGFAVKEAVCAAVFLHGLAGELACVNEGENSVLATDVIEQIGPAMKSLKTILI